MQVSVVERADGIAVVQIAAEKLDMSNAAAFKAGAFPLLTSHSRVILDLSAVDFVDSSGLGSILACLREINRVGGTLVLGGVCKRVRALFELVKMHRLIPLYETIDDAVAGLSEPHAKAA